MISRRLKIAVKDHRNTALPFISALRAAGHEFVSQGFADVMLIDLDPPYLLHKHLLDTYAELGSKIILYPHGGGGPILSYDGLFEPDERVFANLVTGVGHAEFLRRIGYPSPVHTIGWTYSDILPFRACDDVEHVVFAPTHPNGDGSMTSYQRDLNAEVFARLVESPFRITVRHLGSLEDNGLWKADGVTFVDARTSRQFAEIKVADVVVAGEGTFPTLAIATGVPTVMYSQLTAAIGLPGEVLRPLKRPELYADYARYPFDAADGPLEDIIREAARSEAPIADWKRRFIGKPFDQLAFVTLFERLIVNGHEPVRVDATRSFTTLGFADEILERPELLKTYAEAFGPDDDASLVLWAPGLDAQALLALAEGALERAGLDGDRLPDILLAPLAGSPEADVRLGERADAALTEWPATGRIGELPRFGAGDSAALRAAATAPRPRRLIHPLRPRARVEAPGSPRGLSRSEGQSVSSGSGGGSSDSVDGSPTAPGTESSACLRSQSSRTSEISSPRRLERSSISATSSSRRSARCSCSVIVRWGYPSSSERATSSSERARSSSFSRR